MKINIGDNWKTVNAVKIKLDTNLTDYSNWIAGETGSTTNWVAYYQFATGTTIIRQNITDAFSTVGAVGWVVSGNTQTQGTITGGGFNASFGDYNYITEIDPSYDYRVSVWVNRYVVSGGTAFLFGVFATDTGQTLATIKTISPTATGTTNQLAFLNTTAPGNWVGTGANSWRLMVGYIHNSGYTGPNWFSGGTYTTAGVKTTGFTEGLFVANIKNITVRAYNRACGYNAITYYIYPRVDKLDGTEPSITTLLNNEGPWRTVSAMKVNVGDVWKDAT